MTDRWRLPSTLVYIECDIPPGMTIAEYRGRRAAAAAPSRRRRRSVRRRAIALLRRLVSRQRGGALRTPAVRQRSGSRVGGVELTRFSRLAAWARALGRPSVARVRVRSGRRRAPRRAASQSEGGRA